MARVEDTFIDIVFDGPPGPVSGRFVEVEDEDGKGIRIGEWVDRGDGNWALRIGWTEIGDYYNGGQ